MSLDIAYRNADWPQDDTQVAYVLAFAAETGRVENRFLFTAALQPERPNL
jgi:hypothetical protein